MHLTRARTAAAGVALALVAALGWATPAGAADAADRCAALAGVDVPARVIGLPTTGGEVTEATLVAPSGTGATAIGEHCRVSAALRLEVPGAEADILLSTRVSGMEELAVIGGGVDTAMRMIAAQFAGERGIRGQHHVAAEGQNLPDQRRERRHGYAVRLHISSCR